MENLYNSVHSAWEGCELVGINMYAIRKWHLLPLGGWFRSRKTGEFNSQRCGNVAG